jgi:hypothetical protein
MLSGPHGTEFSVSVSYTATPCVIQYALSHVLSVSHAVLGDHGYVDVHFDQANNAIRARDADTVVSLRMWANSPDQCSVEVTSELLTGSRLGEGPNFRRAEQLGDDLAEAAAARFKDATHQDPQSGGHSANAVASTGASAAVLADQGAAQQTLHHQGAAVGSVPAATVTQSQVQTATQSQVQNNGVQQQSVQHQVAPDAGQAAAVPATAPPGWYADPWNPAMLRWFDGIQWTGYTEQPR